MVSISNTTFDLAELVRTSSPEPVYRPWPGYWRATECIGCPKAMLHRAYNHEPHRRYGNPRIMELGLLLEDDIAARLMIQGIWIEHRHTTFQGRDNIPIVCHPDGFFRRNGALRLIEIKSMGHEDFLEVKNFGVAKSNSLYPKQVQLYLDHVGRRPEFDTDEGTWLVIDRNTLDLCQEDFRYDPEIAGQLNERILIAKDAAERHLEPEALSCSSDFFEKLICPWAYLCEPVLPEIADPVLEQAARRFLECKLIKADADEIIEVCRTDIKSVMEALNQTAIRGYGIKAIIRDERRTKTDIDAASKILDPEIMEQIFERYMISVLRIEEER